MRVASILVVAVLGVGSLALGQQTQPGGQAQQGQVGGVEDPFGKVAPAQAAVAASRQRILNLNKELIIWLRNQRAVFEASKDYREAFDRQQAAQAAYDRARAESLASLELETDYVEAKRIRDDITRQIEGERLAKYPDEMRIRALSANRLVVAQKISAREAEVLGKDRAVVDARGAMLAASKDVNGMKKAFELKMRTSDELASARKGIDETTEQYVYNSTYADQVTKTADVLIDYAYYSQYISTVRPTIVNPPVVNYGGYGYGYAPAYGVTAGGGYGYMPGQ